MQTYIPKYLEEILESSARGCYQRNLIDGVETWSGSTLRGSAQSWGDRYARSRLNLARRINAALESFGGRAKLDLKLINSRWHRVLVLQMPSGEFVVGV